MNASVVIVGGGIVGLFLASLLSRENMTVTVIENKKPDIDFDLMTLTARVSAINASSQRLLENRGVWKLLREKAVAPLCQLKVWDSLGGASLDFDSAQIAAPALGAIVENRELIRVLWEFLQQNEKVTLIQATPQTLSRAGEYHEIVLDNGESISAALIVGADGGESWVREQMRTEVIERSYEQSALIAVVETEQSHQFIGWQAFLPEGVLALLPLRSAKQSAIVWSSNTERANALMQLEIESFNEAINNDFGTRLGEIKRLTDPQIFPLVMRHAKNYVQSGLALIGDAAHTIHPLAGQGVNLGLMDVVCLAECLIEAHQKHRDLGSLRVLRRYERWRKGENTFMLWAMRGFKEIFNSTNPLLVQARNTGFKITQQSNFIKNYFMRLAMGERS